MGIIDILTTWGTKKKVESSFKSLKYDKVDISAVDPNLYSKRFLDFMYAAIQWQKEHLHRLDLFIIYSFSLFRRKYFYFDHCVFSRYVFLLVTHKIYWVLSRQVDAMGIAAIMSSGSLRGGDMRAKHNRFKSILWLWDCRKSNTMNPTTQYVEIYVHCVTHMSVCTYVHMYVHVCICTRCMYVCVDVFVCMCVHVFGQ